MKVYNPGTLIVLNQHVNTYRGIILSSKQDVSWWGGGYYNIFWSPTLANEVSDRISYSEVVNWQRTKEAVVYPIE